MPFTIVPTRTTADPNSAADVNTLMENTSYLNSTLIPIITTKSKVLNGLLLSNAADPDHDIAISTGSCIDSTGTYVLTIASPITKQIDVTWVAGTGNGGIATALHPVQNTTWYYVYIIRKDSDGTIDVVFDTSITAANKPAGYTYYLRIGAVRTDGSANLRRFTQFQNIFTWETPVDDYTASNPGTSVVTTAVTAPPNYLAIIRWMVYQDSAISQYGRFFSTSAVDQTAGNQYYNTDHQTSNIDSGAWRHYTKNIMTNSSSQVCFRLALSAAYVTTSIHALGYYESYS